MPEPAPYPGRDRVPIVVLKFTPMRRGPLVGFVDLSIPHWKVIFHGCAVFISGAKRWVQAPMRPVLDPDGNVKRKDASGKPVYLPAVSFSSQKVQWGFSDAAVLALIEFDARIFDAPVLEWEGR